MYNIHEGLSKDFELSYPELDFLVEFSKDYTQILGARMMGGGFAGCTLNIIHPNVIEEFVSAVSIAYFDKFQIKLSYFEALPIEGAHNVKP